MRYGSKEAKPNPPLLNTASSALSLKDRRFKLFDRFRIAAYAGVAVVFCGFGFLSKFWRTAGSLTNWSEIRVHWQQLLVFVVILALTVRWVIATDHEFKLWKRVLNNPIEKRQVYVAIIALSAGLGVSLAYSIEIVWASLALTIYLLANYWAQWLSNDHFRRALSATRTKADDAARTIVLDSMETYWLKWPQLARITSMMFCTGLAYSAAFAARYDHQGKHQWLTPVAYSLLIFAVVTGEIVIAVWRHIRNKNIRQAKNPALHAKKKIQPKLKPIGEALQGRFDNAKNVAYGVILAIFAIAATLNDFKSLWTPSSWSTTRLLAAGIVLFVVLGVLAFRWVMATINEMELWLDWLDNPMTKPLTKRHVYGAMYGLGIALGLLLAFAHNILAVTFIMAAYYLVNYWGQRLSNDHFAQSMEYTRSAVRIWWDPALGAFRMRVPDEVTFMGALRDASSAAHLHWDKATNTWLFPAQSLKIVQEAVPKMSDMRVSFSGNDEADAEKVKQNAAKEKVLGAVLKVLEWYWLKLPQMFRITSLMFFALIAFSLALAGWVQQESKGSHLYLISYLMVILDILAGEVIIFIWRRARDRNIEATELAAS